jgi:hypothetical protein
MDTGDPVKSLSEKLHVPPQRARQVYTAQLDRLACDARIEDFLTILAIRNARAVLRAVAPQSKSDDYDDDSCDEA